ncbi:uncharacterized protein LOC144644860 isoform X2 [Oculina patagonica]
MKSLFLLAFFLCISVGYGLKCYRCVSTKSWDDCEDVKKEMDCPASYDRCYKGYANVKTEGASIEGFEKGCFTADLCDATDKIDFCKGKGECKIDCCSGDLCNAAAIQLVSAVVLIASALVALLH